MTRNFCLLLFFVSLFFTSSLQATQGPVTQSIITKSSSPKSILIYVSAHKDCSSIGITLYALKDILKNKLILNRIRPELSNSFPNRINEIFLSSWSMCSVHENGFVAVRHEIGFTMNLSEEQNDFITLGYPRTGYMNGVVDKADLLDQYKQVAENIVADFIGAHLEAEDIRDAMPSNQRSVKKY